MAGKEVIIKVKVVDDDVDTLVNTGRVILKINGKTLKDTTGNIIFTDVVNGIATVKYLSLIHILIGGEQILIRKNT